MPPIVTKQSPNAQVIPAAPADAEDGWNYGTGVKCLLYGQPKSGKTVLWSTFPKPIRVLLCSGGMRPGELRSIDTPENRKVIHPTVINSTEQLGELVYKGFAGYATVVLDHITGFQDLDIKEILGLEEFLATKFKKAGKGESWGAVDQPTWGVTANHCITMFRKIVNHDGNVVFIAQERADKEEKSNRSDIQFPTVSAGISPGVAKWLNPAADYILHTFKKPRMRIKTAPIIQGGPPVSMEVEVPGKFDYCVHVANHRLYTTGFRGVLHGLPEYIVNTIDGLKRDKTSFYQKLEALIAGKRDVEGAYYTPEE
jgi:hypothetical protein